MKKLVVIALLGTLTAPATAAPSFYGFAGGAFIRGPESSSAVPNVVGQASAAAADAILEAAGFDMGGTTDRCSDEPDNEVVGQDPAPGALAAPGTLVALLLSNGVVCPNSGRVGVRLRGLRIPGL